MMLVVVNLLIANDMITIWDGAETNNILLAFEKFLYLPSYILSFNSIENGTWTFWYRLPSAAILILTLLVFYYMARQLFGETYSQYALLTLGASFFVVSISKTASADAWAFASQCLSWIFLLAYLKQPILKWQLLFYTLVGFAVWVQPLESILFFSLNSLGLYFFHPKKKLIWQLNPFAALLGAVLLFHFTITLDWGGTSTYSSIGSSNYAKFLFLSLLGWFPFIGFLISGNREILYKWKRKEELTIILLCGLISALLSHSILLHGIISIIVGRQLANYFNKSFPFRAFVKTGAVLHLVIVFTFAVVALIYCFLEFGALGFRSALALTTIYWMPSFIAVIGLYGMNKKYVVVGTVWSGLLASFLFYVQLNPLIDSRRGVVKEAFEQVKVAKILNPEQKIYLSNSDIRNPKEKVYGLHYLGYLLNDDSKAIGGEKITIIRQSISTEEIAQDSSNLIGWDDGLRNIRYEIK